jgi:hypothetical protein
MVRPGDPQSDWQAVAAAWIVGMMEVMNVEQ